MKNCKKMLAILLAGVMVLALAGCSAVGRIADTWDGDITSTVNESVS